MTKIVGILNITPDSFSDGGLYIDPEQALEKVADLFSQGADMIDIGAESTRPGASSIPQETEWKRLKPVIDKLADIYDPHLFSVDTRHAFVAERIAREWSPEVIINDVTGLQGGGMVKVITKYSMKVIVGHLPHQAEGDVARAHTIRLDDQSMVRDELMAQYKHLITQGIASEKIILDPGVGFGKTCELNEKLVEFAQQVPNVPVMIGYSRKRFLGEERLSIAANTKHGQRAIRSGACYLRVHDVAPHVRLLSPKMLQ